MDTRGHPLPCANDLLPSLLLALAEAFTIVWEALDLAISGSLPAEQSSSVDAHSNVSTTVNEALSAAEELGWQ